MRRRFQATGIRELAEYAIHSGAVDLAQGIIGVPPPSVLVRTVGKLPVAQLSSYNNRRGVKAFRKAVCAYLSTRHWNVAVEQILGTAGVTGATASALLAHCRPGEHVLLPEPFFIGHQLLLEALGFAVEYFPVPLDAQPDWEAIEGAMRTVAAAIITTPANPTGQVVPFEVLQRLCKAAAKHRCLLLIDEMYREFIWDNPPSDDSAYQELDLSHTVVMRSFSKTYAIPGWRVGFAVTSPERVERMAVRHDALYIGGSTIAQYALAEARCPASPNITAQPRCACGGVSTVRHGAATGASDVLYAHQA